MLATASADFWRWQPHVEVWLLIGCVVGLGVYAGRVIGPKVVPPGQPAVTRRQRRFFVAGVAVLWLASDWPVHDVGEEYLYSVHMVQHFLLTMVMPPLILFAVPEWLGRLIVGDGTGARRVVRVLTRPVVAGVLFNVFIAFSHWSAVVNAAVADGELHYSVHLAVVLLAFLMWMPVAGPLPELRMSLPGQMVYLFLMSVIPTVPASWLAIAEGSVYDVYDHPARLFGLSVTTDQQLAGLFMKIITGFYLWGIIGGMFVRWAKQVQPDDPRATDRSVRTLAESQAGHAADRAAHDAEQADGAEADAELTWEQVEQQLAAAPPAPAEPTP